MSELLKRTLEYYERMARDETNPALKAHYDRQVYLTAEAVRQQERKPADELPERDFWEGDSPDY